MATEIELVTIRREVRVAASPATVFAHLVDPARLGRWLGQPVEVDARPGGAFRVAIAGEYVVSGTYVVVEVDRRVVVTWGWDGEWNPLAPGATQVEFVLEPDGDGTLVRLEHAQMPVDQVDFHLFGWNSYLPRLASVALGNDPGPDPVESILRALRVD